MEILFLSAANSIHTVRWVNALADRGHRIHLVYNRGHNPRKDIDIISEGVALHELKYTGMKGYYLNALELRKLAKMIKPDIIHVHYASGYGTLARVSRIGPVLLSVWGSDVYGFPYENKVKNIILKKNVQYAAKIASTSHCMARQLEKVMEKRMPDIAITPFGVDMKLFDIDIQEKERSQFVIGTIKALKPNYGIKEFILSIDLLMRDEDLSDILKSKIQVEIYGEGDQKKELIELVNRLKLKEVICFKGYVPNINVPSVLSQMDIFCALSQHESFGVAVVEAMAMQVPVVVSDVDGFREVVEDGVTGLIISRNDIEGCKNAIKSLIMNAQLRKQYGVNGRTRVLELYDWEKNVSMMEKLYEDFDALKLISHKEK